MINIKFRFLKVATITLFLTSNMNACISNGSIENQLDQQSARDELPGNIQVIRDFTYGSDPKQRMDIYTPYQPKNAPVILVLHGGGYASGDKSNRMVFINKVNRWVPKGFIVISINTRKLPEADGYAQIEDLALAIATAQINASEWGGNSNKFFIMGFSSAGQMVSLLCAKPSLVTDIGGQRWLAGFSLDGSSMNIPETMSRQHAGFFDKAFGKDPAKWITVSPIDQLNDRSIPLFASCSSKRKDKPCLETEAYAEIAKKLGVRVEVSPQFFSHGGMNANVGLRNAYTRAIERFMASLDEDVAQLLNMD